MSGQYDIPECTVQGKIEAYKKVKWGSLTDNFLDWSLRHAGTHFAKMDDEFEWGRVLNNARLVGKVAAECGFKGAWLDTERYEGSPFAGYGDALLRRRGEEWICAPQMELPSVVLLFTFDGDDLGGRSLVLATSSKGTSRWEPRYTFLTKVERREYGAVMKFTLLGHLTALIRWIEGPTKLEFMIRQDEMLILQYSENLGRVELRIDSETFRSPSTRWAEGVYGDFSGKIIEKQAE